MAAPKKRANLSTKAPWSREESTLLIELYKKHECLYFVASEFYANRNKRTMALEEIAQGMAGLRPGITPEEVKVKFAGLRTQYTEASAKIIASRKSGCGTDSVYVPTLWCFDMLRFLEKHVVHTKGLSNIAQSKKNASSEMKESLGEVNRFDSTFSKELQCLEESDDEFVEFTDNPLASTSKNSFWRASVTSDELDQPMKKAKVFRNKISISDTPSSTAYESPTEAVATQAKEAIASLVAQRMVAPAVNDPFSVLSFGRFVGTEMLVLKDKRNVRQLKKEIMNLISASQEDEDDL